METKFKFEGFIPKAKISRNEINPYGVKIKKACVSCTYFEHNAHFDKNGNYTSNDSGRCKYVSETSNFEFRKVGLNDICSNWEMRRNLMKAGNVTPNSRVKSKMYFDFLIVVAEACNMVSPETYEHWMWYVKQEHSSIYEWWKSDVKNMSDEDKKTLIEKQIERANEAFTKMLEGRVAKK